jgi:hypothetical protein
VLAVQAVGHVQGRVVVRGGERRHEVAEGGGHSCIITRQVQHAIHLVGGGAAGAEAGHRQGAGDAGRGEEQVAAFGVQLPVQVNAEGVGRGGRVEGAFIGSAAAAGSQGREQQEHGHVSPIHGQPSGVLG